MTAIDPVRSTWRAVLIFVVRYVEILVASMIGMVAFGPLSAFVGASGIEALALLMATTMAAGAAAWMAMRRHRRSAIAEMILAIYLAFVVLFPVYWVGAISAEGLMIVGHVLMLPAIAITMLRRREEHLRTRKRAIARHAFDGRPPSET